MGLDFVEFVMAVEDAFEVDLPDATAATLITPRRLIDYLNDRLGSAAQNTSVTQRAFYRTRDAVVAAHGWRRRDIVPATRLTAILPPDKSEDAWLELRRRLAAKEWPPTPQESFLARAFANSPRTVGELASYLAIHSPTTLFDRSEQWTRAQIEEVVRKLIEYHFGLARTQYTLDSRFVKDLHID